MTATAAETRSGARDAEHVEHVDVLILGAGLSGVGAAHHVSKAFPAKSYALLEAREVSGGTWDLFRYPGIRSDSDMQTLGYRFRPWTQAKAIADGPSILAYIRDTAQEAGIDRHIRYGHRAVRAAWSSDQARWLVEAELVGTGKTARLSCSFLHICTGYYDYAEGYTPVFAGLEDFTGRVVHPQGWPEGMDCSGQRVLVIGSGATAMTLVPALARTAAHVTMLQRSPGYVVTLPSRDAIADALRRVLPARAAYAATRWKNVVLQTAEFQLSRRRPEVVKRLIRRAIERRLPAGFDIQTHFTPRYDPWDQRTCLVPDGDLFEVLGDGRASIVTDRIERFTPRGVRLASGGEIEADVVVTATGLNLLLFGGLALEVDGRAVDVSQRLAYKGMMLDGVPNLAFTLGYTNLSWTLKADLASEYACRVLAELDARGLRQVMPVNDDPGLVQRPFLDFKAGYVQRSLDAFPRQGSRAPWQMHQTYPRDLLTLRHGKLADGVLRFSNAAPARQPAPR